jgi:hypothetical protein
VLGSTSQIASTKEYFLLLILSSDHRADGSAVIFLTRLGEIGETRDPPWPVARAALSRTMGLYRLIYELLRDLDDDR